MKLYNYFRSSTSYRVRIALQLKGVGFDYVGVDLRKGAQKEDSFSTLNPHQTLPTLVSGDAVLSQSLAIMDWLEEHYPEPSFWPSDPVDKQDCRELYYAIATEIHAPNNLPVLNYLRQQFDFDQAGLERWNKTWIHRTFQPVEARLAARDWQGEALPFGAPTLLEIVLIPQISNARRWNVDLSPFPNLVQIDAYCQTLEAFKAAHPDVQPDAVESAS